MTVTLYTQPGCGPCIAAKRSMLSKGIHVTEVNVREDPVGSYTVKSLGYTGTPVTVTPTGEHWQGYKPERIQALV